LLNTEISKVSNKNNQEENNELHIQRMLQDLVDGMLMESRDSVSYVLLLQKIVKNGDFDIDYLNAMKIQPRETMKTSATLVA